MFVLGLTLLSLLFRYNTGTWLFDLFEIAVFWNFNNSKELAEVIYRFPSSLWKYLFYLSSFEFFLNFIVVLSLVFVFAVCFLLYMFICYKSFKFMFNLFKSKTINSYPDFDNLKFFWVRVIFFVGDEIILLLVYFWRHLILNWLNFVCIYTLHLFLFSFVFMHVISHIVIFIYVFFFFYLIALHIDKCVSRAYKARWGLCNNFSRISKFKILLIKLQIFSKHNINRLSTKLSKLHYFFFLAFLFLTLFFFFSSCPVLLFKSLKFFYFYYTLKINYDKSLQKNIKDWEDITDRLHKNSIQDFETICDNFEILFFLYSYLIIAVYLVERFIF